MQLRTVIIDDDEDVRSTIAHLIKLYCPRVKIVAQAASIQEAARVLGSTPLDVALVDIQLPDGTAFDLLQQLPEIDFKIIFVTAHEQYALQAFRCSALDYLLKPVDPSDLTAAFAKAELILERENQQLKLNTLLHNLTKETQRIILKTAETIYAVNINEIIRCEATSNYTEFYVTGLRKIVVTQTLKEYDEMLRHYGFFRLHQSHLINLYYLDRYDKKDNMITMRDKSRLPVSSRKKEQLLRVLKAL